MPEAFVLIIEASHVQLYMLHYIRAHKLITTSCILGLFVTSCWLWSLSAPIRGRLAAYRDIRRGQYEVLGYGLPIPWRPQYAQCLRERYNIRLHVVAGCVVSDSLVSYVNAYHSVVDHVVRRKYGRDVFRECADDAATKWRTQRQALRGENVSE